MSDGNGVQPNSDDTNALPTPEATTPEATTAEVVDAPTSVVPGTGFEPTAVESVAPPADPGPPATAVPPGATAVIPAATPTAVVPAPEIPLVPTAPAAPPASGYPPQPYVQPYAQPGYAQDPYGYAQQPGAYSGYPQAPVAYPPRPMPTTSGNAVTALILAIVSWAICPVAAAIVALVFAAKAGKEITNSNGWVTGGGMVLAAKIISWINIVFYGLFTLFFIGMFLFALIVGGMDPGNVYPDPTYSSDLTL